MADGGFGLGAMGSAQAAYYQSKMARNALTEEGMKITQMKLQTEREQTAAELFRKWAAKYAPPWAGGPDTPDQQTVQGQAGQQAASPMQQFGQAGVQAQGAPDQQQAVPGATPEEQTVDRPVPTTPPGEEGKFADSTMPEVTVSGKREQPPAKPQAQAGASPAAGAPTPPPDSPQQQQLSNIQSGQNKIMQMMGFQAVSPGGMLASQGGMIADAMEASAWADAMAGLPDAAGKSFEQAGKVRMNALTLQAKQAELQMKRGENLGNMLRWVDSATDPQVRQRRLQQGLQYWAGQNGMQLPQQALNIPATKENLGMMIAANTKAKDQAYMDSLDSLKGLRSAQENLARVNAMLAGAKRRLVDVTIPKIEKQTGEIGVSAADHANLTNINRSMTMLDSMIATMKNNPNDKFAGLLGKAALGLDKLTAMYGPVKAREILEFDQDLKMLRTQLPQAVSMGRAMVGSKAAIELANQLDDIRSPLMSDRAALIDLERVREQLEAMREISPAYKKQKLDTELQGDVRLLQEINAALGAGGAEVAGAEAAEPPPPPADEAAPAEGAGAE